MSTSTTPAITELGSGEAAEYEARFIDRDIFDHVALGAAVAIGRDDT